MKKRIWIAICGVGLVAIIVCLVIFNSDVAKVNRNLKLAQRRLSEEDYERAIDAFAVVIEIDPRNADAYIGLAQAYVETENLEKAVRLLERGAKRDDSGEIQELLDRYVAEPAQGEAPQEVDSETAVAPQSESAEPEVAEPEPQSEEETPINTGFVTQDGELYYYDASGSPVAGWFEVEGSRYYAGTDGRLYRNGEYEVGGVTYHFGWAGTCIDKTKADAWKQVYIDLIHQYEAGQYDTTYYSAEEFDTEERRYSLINFDDKGVPELVIEVPLYGYSEGLTRCWLYTYDNDTLRKIYEFGNTAHYYYGYIEGKELAVSIAEEGKDCYYYYIFFSSLDGEPVHTYTKHLYVEEDVYGRRYFYDDKQITEEEYNVYREQLPENCKVLSGSSSASEIIGAINSR